MASETRCSRDSVKSCLVTFPAQDALDAPPEDMVDDSRRRRRRRKRCHKRIARSQVTFDAPLEDRVDDSL